MEPDQRPTTAPRRRGGAPVVVALPRHLRRDDIPGLCERLLAAVERSGASRIDCDVGGLSDVDVVAVEAVARLELAARRAGARLRLRRAPRGLVGLLAWLGLRDVLVIEVERQAEQREQVGGVEEGRDPGDPVA